MTFRVTWNQDPNYSNALWLHSGTKKDPSFTFCGYCNAMLADLHAWASRIPIDEGALVVVTRGSPEQNADLGLPAQVLLDPDFSVGAAFGVTGTPSAVLIDADGRIASGMAAGAAGVLAVLNRLAFARI